MEYAVRRAENGYYKRGVNINVTIHSCLYGEKHRLRRDAHTNAPGRDVEYAH